MSFFILCIRSSFNIFIQDTLFLTILINIVLCLGLFCDRIKRKTFRIIILLTSFIILNPGALALIDILIMVYLLRDTKIDEIIKMNFIVLCIFLIFYAISLYEGILKDQIMSMPKGVAHTMGFENANGYGNFGYNIVISIYLLIRNHKKLSLVFLLTLPFVNEYFYRVSLSRTPWLSIYVLILFILLVQLKMIPNWSRYIFACLPLIIFSILLYFTTHYNNYPELNVMLSGRLSENGKAIHRMTLIQWFIGAKSPSDLILDGSYTSFLFEGGIIGASYFFFSFRKKVIAKWKELLPFIPFIISFLALGTAENKLSSAGAISIIFWYLIFNYKENSIQNK